MGQYYCIFIGGTTDTANRIAVLATLANSWGIAATDHGLADGTTYYCILIGTGSTAATLRANALEDIAASWSATTGTCDDIANCC